MFGYIDLIFGHHLDRLWVNAVRFNACAINVGFIACIKTQVTFRYLAAATVSRA
jgi:hypothetical protein